MSNEDKEMQSEEVQEPVVIDPDQLTQAPSEVNGKKDVKWRIINQISRTVRPVAGPGSPDRMKKEFEKLRDAGVPGSIQLLDENKVVVEQHGAFVADKSRRGRDEGGGAYEPTVVERGHRPLDLSCIRNAIKGMPETDPDLDPDPNDEPEVASLKARLLEASQKLIEADKKKREADKKKKIEAAKRPYEAPKVTPKPEGFPKAKADHVKVPIEQPEAPKVEPKAQPKMPAPRSQRVASAPCQGGWSGLLTFTTALNSHLSEMRHTEDRMYRRRRRFLLELIVRVVSGAPVCSSTVNASYSDAADATRM